MKVLIDTNVLAELRKGARANPQVRTWFASLDPDAVRLSVLTLGEIRRGVENIRRRDARSARALERWLNRLLADHQEQILPVDQRIADEWGRLNVPDPLPVVDALLAATAKVHGLTFVTRNTRDVVRSGALLFNPFEPR